MEDEDDLPAKFSSFEYSAFVREDASLVRRKDKKRLWLPILVKQNGLWSAMNCLVMKSFPIWITWLRLHTATLHQSPGDEVYLFKPKLRKHFVPLVFSCFCIAVIITTRCCVPLVLVLCCRVALFFNVFKSGASMSLGSVYLKRANPSGWSIKIYRLKEIRSMRSKRGHQNLGTLILVSWVFTDISRRVGQRNHELNCGQSCLCDTVVISIKL